MLNPVTKSLQKKAAFGLVDFKPCKCKQDLSRRFLLYFRWCERKRPAWSWRSLDDSEMIQEEKTTPEAQSRGGKKCYGHRDCYSGYRCSYG